MTDYNQIPTDDLIPITNISTAPSSTHLRMFMEKVREVYPRCQFSYGAKEVDTHQQNRTVYVYHDWKPLTMGKIGYGNFRNEGGEDNFMVASTQIINDKYSSYSDQYRMKMTKNHGVAISNVKKFLRDVSTRDLAQHFAQNVRNQWSETNSSLESAMRNDFDRIFDYYRNKDTVIRELEHLVSSGHEWLDPEFSKGVSALLQTYTEKMEAARERSPKIMMVSAEDRPSGIRYELASTEDISTYIGDIEWSPIGSVSEDTLSQEYPDIVGRLAMLQMCNIDQWVDGVGCRVTSTVHYVAA